MNNLAKLQPFKLSHPDIQHWIADRANKQIYVQARCINYQS